MGPRDTSPVGFQSEIFWESALLVGILKAGALDVGSKPFTPQREAGSWGFLPIVWCSADSGFHDKSVPQPVLCVSMWVFSQSSDV